MVPPHLRRRARERALQILFGLDFTGYDPSEALPLFWESCPTRRSARAYAEHLVKGVTERKEELDAEIAQRLDNWRIERLGVVERNILRLALFEMMFESDVPPRVATNEAIELAKMFGAEDSPRFINGVLDRYCRSER